MHAEMAQGDSPRAIEVFQRHHFERQDLHSQTIPGPAEQPVQLYRIDLILRISQRQTERPYLP